MQLERWLMYHHLKQQRQRIPVDPHSYQINICWIVQRYGIISIQVILCGNFANKYSQLSSGPQLGRTINVNVSLDALLRSFCEMFVAIMFTLKQWCTAMYDLSNYFPSVPRNLRNMSHTSHSINKMLLSKGECIHFGLHDGLWWSLSRMAFVPDSIDFRLKFDELSLYQASRIQVWPILASVIRPVRLPVSSIGFCCGPTKPLPVKSNRESTVVKYQVDNIQIYLLLQLYVYISVLI